MLNSEPTWIASTSASSETPAARTSSASSRGQLVGVGGSAARGSRASRGAAGRPARCASPRLTPSQTSSPSAYAATAAWECVQKGHCWRCETQPAKSSRSPCSSRMGRAWLRRAPRRRSGRRSPAGSRASSGRRSARCRAARGSGRGLRGSPARVPSRRRRASEAARPCVEPVQPGADGRRDGLLEDLVVGVAGVLQRLRRRRR